MKRKKKECAHCGTTSGKVRLYWSDRNLLKMLLKTHYCVRCAKIIVPGREFIQEAA